MIELNNVDFQYEGAQKKNCLKNINLYVKRGEVILLTGESGCGKTTLTRLLNGLIPNYYDGNLQGEVKMNGQKINALPLYETAKMVGSVFQNPRSQFFNVDTTSELAFGCENRGIPTNEIKDRINKAVIDLNLKTLMDRSIFNLSGGEKQKIACASVCVCNPDLYVLDEPSSNLDICAIEDLRKIVKYLKSKGKTIVIAEHRLYYLRELADRIIYMKNGTIETEYSSKEMNELSISELEDMGLRSLSPIQLVKKECISQPSLKTIVLKNFTFAYKNQALAISIPSLYLPEGSAVAVIGHNGAGKSTFARCLCGLEKGCKGVLCSCNINYKNKDRLKNCFMVMQDVNHQLFTESVFEEVLLSMKEEDVEKAEIILNKLHLLELKERHPMSLSGGQKQRVAIASAIASERKIILFDEPSSGLDLRHMKEVADNLNNLRSLGKMLFVISHDLELILKSCTYVLHIENGKVMEQYHIDESGKQKLIRFFVQMEP